MSKALTTGRFSTREELEYFVMNEYLNTPRKIVHICKAARISAGTFNRIYDDYVKRNQKGEKT